MPEGTPDGKYIGDGCFGERGEREDSVRVRKRTVRVVNPLSDR